MSAPPELERLVDRFEDQKDAFRSGRYNETQARREFIDPFFRLLGWDIDNQSGAPEAYKDVIHEDAIRIGGAHKAPDYGFRVGGTRQFFVEAKAPSVNLDAHKDSAFQLRRYAWSAKLPVSILTDFEEFAVYDCRVRPVKDDKTTTARIQFHRYEDYPENWEDLVSLFSKGAVQQGSLDAYAQATSAKRGAQTVDAVFLKEIELWRELLATDIATRNPELTQRQLNFAVQMTIDRIVFLRMTEDRGIEEYGRLQALLNGSETYERLQVLYRQADERYNSGLFHFRQERDRPEQPDELTPNLKIGDKTLKTIFKNLYFPDSPYEFSVLPVEVLGQVYEQFLGKVIDLSPNRKVVIEEKPEIRKAGGVYYTPKYIADYIVVKTVGALLEGKKPGPKGSASKITIVDPACGSGSFLIGAYRYLLDWHRDKYLEAGPDKHRKELYQGTGGQWLLTTSEKKRILLNNIYGVDIDPQAVEVTKLSLLLKVLEGESSESLVRQLSMFREPALPDLGSNIKCGNSLVEPSFYGSQQLLLFDEEQHYRINVFKWEDAFPKIFTGSNPGFDAVIGNPPWISLSGKFSNEIYTRTEISYLIDRFKGNSYMPNMYEYFVTLGLELVAQGGYFSFVIPDRLGFNRQFVGLRERILKETSIDSLVYKVPFPGVTADTLIFVLRKVQPEKLHLVAIAEHNLDAIQIAQSAFMAHPKRAFEFFDSGETLQLINKIDTLPEIDRISSICETTSGFGGKSSLIHATRTSDHQIVTLKGNSIGRYQIRKHHYFDFCRENITGRTTDPIKLGASPKVLMRKTGDSIIATYDTSGVFPEQSLYFLYGNRTEMDFRYLLGVLNSKVLNSYYKAKSLTNRRSIAQVKKEDLDLLPIPRLDLAKDADRIRHDQLTAIVDRLLLLNEKLLASRTSHESQAIVRQVQALEDVIDATMYELFALTESEIALVENQR